jgi:hypothetical protein
MGQNPNALAQTRHRVGMCTGMNAVGRSGIHLMQKAQGTTRGTGGDARQTPGLGAGLAK